MITSAENLRDFDWIVVNTSAGKDSQAMMEVVCRAARLAGIIDRVVAVHADLGKVEWEGARTLAEFHAAVRGIRFEVVEREGQDLLEHIDERGMFPDSGNRYCTSDHKRDPIAKLFTRLVAESGPLGRPIRILNCMGLRGQESPARAKKISFEVNKRVSNGKRIVFNWLPLHDWSESEVWARMEAGGLPHHAAYDLGMPRLSCCFCIFATPDALMIAGYYNRNLLRQYVAVEKKHNHTFRNKFSLASILARLDAGEEPPTKAPGWACA